ncbi:MAG: hypothetical protein WCY84_01000 [Candidatus Cloacimonadaceae bacterium]
MKKCILLLLLFAAALLGASTLQQDAAEVAARLLPFIDTNEAVILDIRCGEWTAALFHSLSLQLLEKGADLRDFPPEVWEEELEQNQVSAQLKDFGLETANLVSLELNLQWKTIEHKSFFSYRSERKPEYVFSLKQIRLPQRKISQLESVTFSPAESRDTSLSAPRLRWFEPIFAATALASIIFLLWTIE